MILDLNSLPPAPQPVTITTGRRALLIRDIHGVMQHCPAGTSITVSPSTLAEMDSRDFEIVGTVPHPITNHRAP